MPILSRRTAATLLARTGLAKALRWLPLWNGLLTLNYHRIGVSAQSPFDRGVFSTTPDEFDAQIHCLRNDCEIIAAADLDRARQTGRGRYVLITFDDGYRDTYEVAFPILQAYRAPAILFIATGFLDRRELAWWDEIAWMVRSSSKSGIEGSHWFEKPIVFDDPDRQATIHTLLTRYKSLPGGATTAYLDYVAEATGTARQRAAPANLWMTWDMVREMQAGGIDIGAHTVNHPVMAHLSKDRQAEEINESIRRIADEVGVRPTTFSYPAGKLGKFNDDTRACLQEANISMAFSHYGGFRRFSDWDPYDIRRIPIEPHMTGALFSAITSLPSVFAR